MNSEKYEKQLDEYFTTKDKELVEAEQYRSNIEREDKESGKKKEMEAYLKLIKEDITKRMHGASAIQIAMGKDRVS